ncbi:MAG: dehydrogenase E1 component subunit alpha/beta [Bacteroidota bacterium]
MRTENKIDMKTKNINKDNKSDKIDKKVRINALRTMLLTRKTDHKIMNLLKQGKSYFHMSAAGHEAIQIAVGMQMQPGIDWAYPYYRDLAFLLTLGEKLDNVFLHMLAKGSDPMTGGRQMPNHWGSKELNIPAQSSPTGTQFLQAVGTALALKRKGNNAVTYVSSGDGTTSEGEFYEAVNWASREKLPVIFVIQNNKLAISVPVEAQNSGKNSSIAQLMSGFENLLKVEVDGTDFNKSYDVAQQAFDYVRNGNGPVLIEAHVVRLASHSSSDDQRKYREKEDIEADQEKDPIQKLKDVLIKEEKISVDFVSKIESELNKEIEKAAEYSLRQNEPKAESAVRFILDESGKRDRLEYEKSKPAGNPIVMVDAINHALHEEMEINEKIYVFGEDVADRKGGVFTSTKGLSTKYGEERVFNSPLAEASIAGIGIGMALVGLKPCVEIQFGDYIWPAFMQMRDELVTYRYRSNNQFSSPMVFRVAVGGFIHGGLFHSQNIEGFFSHVPGLLIAYPSSAADAKGLLKTALRLNDPVLFLEHKGLYRQSYASSPEPDHKYLLPFGKANTIIKGNDLTIITYGAMVHEATFALRKLKEEGHSIELIDIRTMNPLDEETIFNSVRKTGKAIVIHEDTLTAGFGAEISARITDSCFEYLDGPVRRVAAKDTFIPYHPNLEKEVLPNRDKIYTELKELLLY